MVDYIIVGCGIAGIAFAETCLQQNRSILVYEDQSQNASIVAAGIYNPVILKRFTGFNNAQHQIDMAKSFYQSIEKKLNRKFDFELSILRKFTSVEEQNDWFLASDKPNLVSFLDLELEKKTYKNIDAPFLYGKVLQTGYIDTKRYLQYYKSYLKERNCILVESFNYEEVNFHGDGLDYKGIKCKNIVFAEGYGMLGNPFFNYLPLDGTKGELLVIKCKDLDLDVILNSSLYFVPLGENLFKVGATYNWDDKTNVPTEKGKNELLEKIASIIDCEFEIIEHLSGVRPTVNDRKPLLGTHSVHEKLHVFNGLGTRGVLIAPELAQILFDFIENKIAIPLNVNISRYDKIFYMK